MRVTEFRQVEREVVVDYICNMCGLSCKTQYSNINGVECYTQFGYDAELFGDMTEIQLCICERCLYELNSKAKISFIINEETKEIIE